MNTFISIFQISSIVILAIGAFCAIRQLSLLREQLDEIKRNTRTQHDWNRRQTTQQYLYQVLAKDVPSITQDLENSFKVNIYDKAQTVFSVLNELSEDQKKDFEIKLKKLFNMFELISVGIKHHILDDEIGYQYAGFLLSSYWHWGEDLIRKYQEKHRAIWLEFETCAIDWTGRLAEDSLQVKRPGKTPSEEG